MRTWTLEDAKNQFSEVVRRALADGPQRVTREGRGVVVVIGADEYDRLVAPPVNLVDFFQASPLAAALADGEIDLERPRDLGREVAL